MSSSVQGKADSAVKRVSDEEAAVFPEHARPTDESPTVISKTPPVIEPISSSKNKITDLSRRPPTREAIIAELRGQRLAHFELVDWIGEGGMAAVIRARDTQLDRFVALKILPPEMAQEPENVQRFHQEAKAAAKLDHENIARVFYCGEDLGLHFIAFEFVEGINLRTMLEKRGRIPVAEAIRYVLQVAAGLEHAATRGVVHRDVKPSNIIITPAGRAKLVDMGLARSMERRSEKDLTQSGVTLGTFDYISPEQALEPREADTRSDIYSLGCTFYHLLTGQPPVPEGTPAKKLHHHQYESPLDPRVIDPIIPDDLVLILGKMMAKKPTDRYQRPIHLVHHLMKLAQKFGAADDMPEGMLVVDAPLPSEPKSRPLLVMGMALATLVALVLIVALGTDPRPYPITSGPVSADKGKQNEQKNPEVAKKDDKKSPGNGPKDQPVALKTADDLKEVLKDAAVREIKVGNIDLTSGVTLPKRPLTLIGSDVETSSISFRYLDKEKGAARAGVTIEGDEVTFRQVRFQLDADVTPTEAVAAVAVRGARSVLFERCIFEQSRVPAPAVSVFKEVPVASILIDTSGTSLPPIVTIKECLFDAPAGGGQVAVAINGPARVTAINCAFKPHGAMFQFRKDCNDVEKTQVDVANCVAFITKGPAFSFKKSKVATISASKTVFARPDNSIGSLQPDLISVVDDSKFVYVGEDNIYHNLNNLLGRPSKGPNSIAKNEEFIDYIKKNNGKDERSKFLMQSDAAYSPLQNANPLTTPGILAFQLKAKYHGVVGLTSTWLGEKMPPPPVDLAKKTKIIDAEDDGSKPGVVFKTIADAIAKAEDGDTLLIKHASEDQDVLVSNVAIKPGISVTLKPYEKDGVKYQPRLRFDKALKDKDTFLFQVRGSTLNLKDLEVFLEADDEGYEAQSMVQMGESSRLVFTRCVLTMKNANGVRANVAKFVDLELMPKMKMDAPTAAVPSIAFEECFIRGRGDLVTLHGSRRLEVALKNSLIGLEGSLLDITATNNVMSMNQRVVWKMDHSSIFTTKPMFALRSMTEKGLALNEAFVDYCLLVSLSPDQSVAAVKMGDENVTEFKKCIDWLGGGHNFYANFDKVKIRDWRDQFPESSTNSDVISFPRLTEKAVQKLWDARPEWFKPAETDQDRLENLGVPADSEQRLLPAPWDRDG